MRASVYRLEKQFSDRSVDSCLVIEVTNAIDANLVHSKWDFYKKGPISI